MPPPLDAARCGPAPAQRALLPVAVGAMNIHDVRDRQTSDRRRSASSLNAPAYWGRGIINIIHIYYRHALTRWLHLRFDFDWTAVRLIIKGHSILTR